MSKIILEVLFSISLHFSFYLSFIAREFGFRCLTLIHQNPKCGSHPHPSLPWSLDFPSPAFGPWFVVLHPVNYLECGFPSHGLGTRIHPPALSGATQGNLELLPALGAGTQPVPLPPSLQISSICIFSPFFAGFFWLSLLSGLNSTCPSFPGVWGESCGHLEDLGTIPGASVATRGILAAA